MIELLQHFVMCVLACFVVHMLECNWPAFHRFTHLHWLKRERRPKEETHHA